MQFRKTIRHAVSPVGFSAIHFVLFWALPCSAQNLDEQLRAERPSDLVAAAYQIGDAKRGAILFYQPYMACRQCHQAGEQKTSLGPDLARNDSGATTSDLVESLLLPSKVIKKGYAAATVITASGRSVTGLIAERKPERVSLRDISRDGQLVTFEMDDIDEWIPSETSIMPGGQVNVLASRQQFLDLVRYLLEIREGGPARALELEPPPQLYAARPLPEYEKEIDHRGMIAALDDDSYRRGEAIYNRLCINCHGTQDRPGSLPTSMKFASGKFKNGGDPFTMYQTLTRGFGMMVAQTWMVPEQKYDAIHYIREAYLKRYNKSQYVEVNPEYLVSVPKGTTRGPRPSNIVPWEQMNYGHNLVATYEVGNNGTNFAYKGNAVRLDPGPGGVSQGRHWMVFDYDTLRVSAAWSGKGFIDWNGINFNGRHGVHPRIVGSVELANPSGPGWAQPGTESFEDVRIVGRDGRRYGPLPRDWAHYKGMYYHGDRVVVAYTVGKTHVLEMPGLKEAAENQVFLRNFEIGPRSTEMLLQVAHRSENAEMERVPSSGGVHDVVVFDVASQEDVTKADAVDFDGTTHLEVAKAADVDMNRDFSIFARMRTREGGTIFAQTASAPEWVPNGQTFFVRDGRLCFDIGWVGAVRSLRKVNDGQWHDVAVTFDRELGVVKLYVDGRVEGSKPLRTREPLQDAVVRLGFTSTNFPEPLSYFEGEIEEIRFHDKALQPDFIAALSGRKATIRRQPRQIAKYDPKTDDSIIGRWRFGETNDGVVRDVSGNDHDARLSVGTGASNRSMATLVAGLAGPVEGVAWEASEGNLRLRIPAGDKPIRFAVWSTNLADRASVASLMAAISLPDSGLSLEQYTQGGPARWPEVLSTDVRLGDDTGAFAVDVLTYPADNPWFCRGRLTGFDFFDDPDVAAVSAWDGSVWLVRGLSQLPVRNAEEDQAPKITWQRIASGLFQPLGVKVVDGKIFVTCRDQICILHDLNGDGETDFYESFNNDHQVTDHFHEFAMGLQSDDDGNFYYAKSARHALTALVPHHGTLLRVSKDGSRTDILATGFRAANGVCVNPDGTFIVTDQEGHWNPKNRINWVREGGFYGNMFGYHDVTDSSDDAMEQPLCWITNAFDRSPSELLWVDKDKWGPLAGSLLNFSYGYGKIYVVPHEQIDGQMQGGMCELPLELFPTGIMRGRFHSGDNQLYTCGMFAWAGNQQKPGGFYRVRHTGKPVDLPIGLHARERGMEIEFSDVLDPESVTDVANYNVKVWSLKRTENYGSEHYNEHGLTVTSASLSSDGKSVTLEIPDIGPTWCMEIKYAIRGSDGRPVRGTIHNTIHKLSP